MRGIVCAADREHTTFAFAGCCYDRSFEAREQICIAGVPGDRKLRSLSYARREVRDVYGNLNLDGGCLIQLLQREAKLQMRTVRSPEISLIYVFRNATVKAPGALTCIESVTSCTD